MPNGLNKCLPITTFVQSDNDIRSIIETRNINGKTWYRLLVGAYASKDEANRFKPTVQAVKGFENAMIREYY